MATLTLNDPIRPIRNQNSPGYRAGMLPPDPDCCTDSRHLCGKCASKASLTANALGDDARATVAKASRDPQSASKMAFTATARALPDANDSERDDSYDALLPKAERAMKASGSDPAKAAQLHAKLADAHDQAFAAMTKAEDTRAARGHHLAAEWHRRAAELHGAATNDDGGGDGAADEATALNELHDFAQILNDSNRRRVAVNQEELDRLDVLPTLNIHNVGGPGGASPRMLAALNAEREELDAILRRQGSGGPQSAGPLGEPVVNAGDADILIDGPTLEQLCRADFHASLTRNGKDENGCSIRNAKAEGSNADYIVSPGGHSRRTSGGSNVIDAGRDDGDAGDGADTSQDQNEYAFTSPRRVIAKPEGSGGPGGGGAGLLGKSSGSSGRGTTGGTGVDDISRFLPEFLVDEDAHSPQSLDAFADMAMSAEDIAKENAKRMRGRKIASNCEADAGDVLELPEQSQEFWQSVVNEQRDSGTRPR